MKLILIFLILIMSGCVNIKEERCKEASEIMEVEYRFSRYDLCFLKINGKFTLINTEPEMPSQNAPVAMPVPIYR